MGLLGKAVAINAPAAGSGSFQSFIADFHRKNPQFHVIVLQGNRNISGMIACHGGAVTRLPGGNSLILLPGALDRELFAHRLSQSAGLTTLSQLSADSPALALVTLSPYLE